MCFSNIHIGYCRKGVSFSYPQLLLNHMIEFNQTCFNFFLIDCRCAPAILFFRFFLQKCLFQIFHIGYYRKKGGGGFYYPQLLQNHMILLNQTSFNVFLIDCRCAPDVLFNWSFFYFDQIDFWGFPLSNLHEKGGAQLVSITPLQLLDAMSWNFSGSLAWYWSCVPHISYFDQIDFGGFP